MLPVFFEPGAVNHLGEYKWWLHVWRTGEKEYTSNIYPWPLASPEIDWELLAATMRITRMKNWPGNWPVFNVGQGLIPNGKFNAERLKDFVFYCKLAPGMGKHFVHVSRFPAQIIPEVFINALT